MSKLFLGFFLLLSCQIFAQQTVQHLYDPSEEHTFKSIKAANFETIEDTNKGLENGVYWFKIPQIENPRAMLTIPSNHTSYLEAVDSKGVRLPKMANTRYPSFFLIDRLHDFPIYLKANFEQEAYFPIEVVDEATFISTEKYDLLGTGVFYGTILSLIIATLIFYFITKNKVFLFHGLLALVIGYIIASKDNLFYLVHIENPVLVDLELFSHFLVGFFGFCFAYYYLKLQYKSKRSKIFLGSSLTIAAITMVTFFVTGNMLFYFISDLFTVLTILGVWIIGIRKSKKTILNWAIGLVYAYNIYLMSEVFVLHTYGKTMFGLGPLAAKVCVMVDLLLITFAMMYSFKKLQLQSSLMKQQIKTYLQRIETLDQYKKVQDADDSYLETLIAQFGLSNMEVKVLQGISKGHTNEHIAAQYKSTVEGVESATKNLYQKLGIEADQEIRMLVS